MKEIKSIAPFTNEIEIVSLPPSRIIGREVRNGGKLGNTAPALWDDVYASGAHRTLEELSAVVSTDLFGWTMEYDPETKTFIYIVCALTPAGTAVPDGFVYRDIPETEYAVGLFGESVNRTLKRAFELAYIANWSSAGRGWNAELYIGEEEKKPPKKTRTPWHWLVPVRKNNS